MISNYAKGTQPVSVTSSLPKNSNINKQQINVTNNLTDNETQCQKNNKNHKQVSLQFKLPDLTTKTFKTEVPINLLEFAHEHKLPIEGACEGGLACTTCHVILNKQDYEKFNEPSMREEDLLDSAPCVTEYSRLGCQLNLTDKHDNCTFELPKYTKNYYVDGFVPEPH